MFHAAHSPLTDSDTPTTSTRSPRPTMGSSTANATNGSSNVSRRSRVADRDAGHERHDAEQARFDTERPERLARCRHDDEHEQERREQLALRRQPVHDARPMRRRDSIRARADRPPVRVRPRPSSVRVGRIGFDPDAFDHREHPEADRERHGDTDQTGETGARRVRCRHPRRRSRRADRRPRRDPRPRCRVPCRPRPSRGRRATSWRTG